MSLLKKLENFRKNKSPQEILEAKISIWKNISLFETWKLLKTWEKKDLVKTMDKRITLNYFNRKDHDNSILADTTFSFHLSMYEDLVLMWILKEVQLDFYEFVEKEDRPKVFNTCKISENTIRSDSYSFEYLWMFAKDECERIFYIDCTFILNEDRANKYIAESIQKWLVDWTEDGKVTLWRSKKQVDAVLNYIKQKIDIYWNRPIEIKINELEANIDVFVCCLYLESIWVLIIEYGAIFPIEQFPHNFYIKVMNTNTINQIRSGTWWENIEKGTSKRVVVFEKDSWTVSIKWKEVWCITKWNQEYYFFEFLYDNYGKAVPHSDIVEHLKVKCRLIDEKMKYKSDWTSLLSWIKFLLPQKLKPYILTPKFHYQLTDFPEKKKKKQTNK